MHIVKQVAEYKIPLFAAIAAILTVTAARAAVPVFQKGEQGMVRPFKLKGVSLPDFVRGYAKFTGTRIEVGGSWESELKGSVNLLINRPIKEDVLTELFHQALQDNGYAVIDGPDKSGWIIQQARDARDGAIPVYDSTEVPASHRMITVIHTLKYASADNVARFMRSFMPVNSRIIPQFRSQLSITNDGINIQKSLKLVQLLDTEEAAKRARDMDSQRDSKRVCNEREHKIENITVEKLEIKDVAQMGSGSTSSTSTSLTKWSSFSGSSTPQRKGSVRGGK
ncbi:MAG: hypothetical protein AABZ06_05845 [Bdellovibrionota bacterium]